MNLKLWLCFLLVSVSVYAERALPNLSLAVLPFKNQSQKEWDWLSVGIADSMVYKLSFDSSIHLLERVELEKLKNLKTDASIIKGLDLLGANHLVLGSYVVSGSQIKINARVIHASSSRIQKGATISLRGEVNDILQLQTRLAVELVKKLEWSIPRQPLMRNMSKNYRSFHKYALGKLAFDRSEYRQAIELFRDALNLNEGVFFTQAHQWEGRSWLAIQKEGGEDKSKVNTQHIHRFRKDASQAAPAFYDLALALYETGSYPEALKAVDDYLRWIANHQKLNSWRFSFKNLIPSRIGWGPQSVVISSYSGNDKNIIKSMGRLPRIKEWIGTNEGWKALLVCVSLKDGQLLWMRRAKYNFEFLVCPYTGDVLVNCHTYVERLRASDGKTLWKKKLAKRQLHINVIRDEEQRLIPDIYAPHREYHGFESLKSVSWKGSRSVLDLTKMTMGSLSYQEIAPWLFSNDKRFALSYSVSLSPTQAIRILKCQDIESLKTVWEYRCPGGYYGKTAPFWHEGDVFALHGNETGKAELVRLQRKDGKIKWRYLMPQGRFFAGKQIRNGAYAHHRANMYGLLGKYMGVMDSQRVIHLLNPADGSLQIKLKTRNNALCFPGLFQEQLIHMTDRDIYAVALKQLENPFEISEKQAMLLKAKCLAKLKREKESMKLTEALLRLSPDQYQAWEHLAHLHRNLDMERDESLSRIQMLSLRKKFNSPRMQSHWSLVRRVDMGSRIVSLNRFGDKLYIALIDGTFLKFDLKNYRVEVIKRYSSQFKHVRQKKPGQLTARFTDRKTRVILNIPEEELDNTRELAMTNEIRRAFHPISGYDGPIVKKGERYVQTGRDGKIEIWDGKKLLTFNSPLKNIRHWKILNDEKVRLGYGDTGVFQLNENWTPQKHLVKLPSIKNRGEKRVYHLIRHQDLLFLTTEHESKSFKQTPVFQLRKLNGELLGEVQAHYRFDHGMRKNRVFNFRDGVLFVGHELAFFKKDPFRRTWNFAPPFEKEYVLDRFQTRFFNPIVTKDRLIVAGQDYAIYVFDLDTIKTRP